MGSSDPPAVSFFAEKQREIHIWEFPHNFRIRLDPVVMEELVNRAAANIGGIGKLANVLKVARNTLYKYRIQRTFTPLSVLLRLCELAGDEFAIEKMEPHIVAYKGSSFANPIRNPKLPVVETPGLFAFMGHMAGDGGHTANSGIYTNTEELLIDEFLGLLHEAFGEVPVRINVDRQKVRHKNVIRVWFNLAIVRLLWHLYHIDFRTFTARVPQRLFELPKEYASAYLRAFGDDEGCVQDTDILLCSANKKLLQDILTLVQTKFPELGTFVAFAKKNENSGPYYRIRFRARAMTNYKTLIGFTHSKKKQELNQILARRERGWFRRNYGVTRRMLLEVLASSPLMTRKALARRLTVTVGAIIRHLKGLIEMGFVQVKEEKTGPHKAKLFEITERGRKFLQLPPIGLLSRSEWLIKVKILKTFTSGGMTVKELQQIFHRKIRHQLTGIKNHGKQRMGLLELNLVERSGRGCKTDPHIYSLTETGKQVLEELETFIHELDNSD